MGKQGGQTTSYYKIGLDDPLKTFAPDKRGVEFYFAVFVLYVAAGLRGLTPALKLGSFPGPWR